MISYKHCSVIDKDEYYVELVLVLLELDEQGCEQGQTQYYTLKSGERLVDTPAPIGFVKPRWNGEAWVEAATPEEIEAWEREHPAPIAPPAPTLEERTTAAEQAILALMGGIANV